MKNLRLRRGFSGQAKQERTVVLIKPDGVKRGLIGEITSRIEKRGLKIIALAMISPTRKQIDKHYPKDPAWIKRLGEKSLWVFGFLQKKFLIIKGRKKTLCFKIGLLWYNENGCDKLFSKILG